MNDVMLDLETYGNRQGHIIRSVGALFFDRNSDKIGSSFYMNIDHDSCVALGMVVDAGTAAWWAKQSKAAQDALLVDPQPVTRVAAEFCKWFKSNRGELVWSQGSNFDEPLWSWTLSTAGQTAPWKFWNARCTRTVYDAAGFNPFSVKRAGTHHDALDDCKHQAVCVQRSFARLRGGIL